MTRPLEFGGVSAYFQAVQQLLSSEASSLTQLIPHLGERGRNDEERLRQFFAKVLPRRFKIGTGFMVCSEDGVDPSPQTDIIIYDDTYNAPIVSTYFLDVHPIESVYAFVEVKYELRKKGKNGIKQISENIRKIRSLAESKIYVEYGAREKADGKHIVDISERRISVKPRSYVFCYTSRGFRTIEHLRQALEELAVPESHFHGVLVLDRGWFLRQTPYATENEDKFVAHHDDAFIRFYRALLHGVASIPMGPASMDRYIDREKFDWATGWAPERGIGA